MLLLALMQEEVERALDGATPYENWQIVLAFILPLIISVILKSKWDQNIQATVAFLVSVVLTVVGMYLDGTLLEGGFDVVVTPLKVFPLAIAFFYGLWKPVGATGAIHTATG